MPIAAASVNPADRADDPVAKPRKRPSARGAFWLLVALVAIIGLDKAVYSPLDPDLFWHIQVARQLRHEGIHPIVDHISFSSRTQPWTPYSWLAELGMEAVWNVLGYRGAVLLLGVTIVGLIFLIALGCRELAGANHGMNCLLATCLAVYLCIAYLSFRPVTFAIFWLALVGWLLLRDRRLGERSRAVWWVAPITVLLANIHLVVVIAPIWVGCLLIGALWELRSHPEERAERGRRVRRYGLLLLVVIPCSLATPMLPGAIRSAWDYQFHDVMVRANFIKEMTPIYAGLGGMITVTILAGLIGWSLEYRKKVRIGEWLWLFAAAAMMLRLGRFTPMFAIIAAPVLAAAIPGMSDAVLKRSFIRNALVVIVAMLLIRVALAFPRPSESLDGFLGRDDVFSYPAAAARFVSDNIHPHYHRVINEFTWGGYLGWRLGDEYQILLDGRTQVYPAKFWKAIYLDGDEPRLRLLKQITADAAILPLKKSAFADSLHKLGWKTIYTDAHAQVLIPPVPPSPATAP
jgi:hypothetical protein